MSNWPEFNPNPRLNSANNFGHNSPLHYATQNISIDTIILLLEKGAKVDVMNKNQKTPLHIVVERSRTCSLEIREKEKAIECIKLLLNYHADPNLHDKFGCTSLHYAAMQSEPEYSTILIQYGANIYEKTSLATCKKGWSQSVMMHFYNNMGQCNDSALKLLIKNCPDVVLMALDRCIEQSPKDPFKWSPNLDFLNIGAFQAENSKESVKEFESGIKKSKSSFIKEILLVRNEDVSERSRAETDVSNSLRKIIQHPISQFHLHQKWNYVKWHYYITVMMTHFVYSTLYTFYTIINFHILCEPKDRFDMVSFHFNICISIILIKRGKNVTVPMYHILCNYLGLECV